MKRLLVLTLAALTVAALVPQNLSAAVGIKGGFNLANLSIKPTDPDMPDFKDLRGLTGGVFFTLNLGFVSIQPEILYSRRGLMWEFEWDIDEMAKIEYMTDYIEVPVLLKLNVLPAGPVRPVVFGGPSFGYLLKATGRFTTPEGTETEDIKDMFEKTAIGGVVGAGIEIKTPVVLLTLDGRYHIGVTNIMKDAMEAESAKHKGFSVMVGIGF
ncbi:MAG: PorT family protein [Candidatus Aminicenantes bacterium]|nr:PorT family protein [Candidatus Aminicenantes bacterium]